MAKRATRKRQGAEFIKWMGPLLDCLRQLGAARPRQVVDWIAERESLPDDARELLESKQERFYNQVHWARQYLVWEGFIDDSKHGIWSLTPRGSQAHLSDEQAREIFLKWVKIHAEARRRAASASESARADQESPALIEPVPGEEVIEVELLTVLRSLSPTGFERICRHFLLAYGFESVTNTKQSRDGGIDGEGVLKINPFVSSVVVFQCKRYQRSVTREEVTRLRGDAGGRADKAILITTGTFTSDARKEAQRVTPHIELIDGEQLVAMFEEKQLGMKPRTVYGSIMPFSSRSSHSGQGGTVPRLTLTHVADALRPLRIERRQETSAQTTLARPHLACRGGERGWRANCGVTRPAPTPPRSSRW